MKQHGKPVLVRDGRTVSITKLDSASREFDEQWLQQVIDNNPDSLPITEIEPAFSGSISLCQELPLKSGACDNILINEAGYITVIECKLWRNMEARRKVVAQVLDYAKDISQLTYDQFELAVLRARSGTEHSLVNVVREYFPDLDEKRFVDGITKRLREARFLLLIAGDGIRENAEELIDFLNRYGNMRFIMAFVEMPVYRVDGTNDVFVTPRVTTKTTELTRILEPLEKSGAEASRMPGRTEATSASVADFFERLQQHIGVENAGKFQRFTSELTQQTDIQLRTGRGKRLSLSLKSGDDRYNFACVWEDGYIDFYGLVQRTGELGQKEIGVDYLEEMAQLVSGQVQPHPNEWNWKVVKNGSVPALSEYLSVSQQWAELIQLTLQRIREAEGV